MRPQKSRCGASYVSSMSCLLWLARSAARLAGSERFSHGSHDRADAQLLSGRFPAPMRRIRPPIPLAAGTAFRRRDPSTGRRLSALSMVGHSPPGPAPAASGRTGTVRSQDQASLAPVGTRPVNELSPDPGWTVTADPLRGGVFQPCPWSAAHHPAQRRPHPAGLEQCGLRIRRAWRLSARDRSHRTARER